MLIRFCLIALLFALSPAALSADEEPIVFADLNWDSARLQNRIAQYIIKKGYGYATELIPGATVDLLESLLRGESDVMMELWLPQSYELWRHASLGGQLFTLGESMSGLSQSAFTIPAYMQEAHPGLDSVEDLKEAEYYRLFASAESEGKARLATCPQGWTCNTLNAEQVKGYGLADTVKLFTPESESALHQGLYEAYERGQPWLGFLDSAMAPWLELDLVQLEEPPYSDECWLTTKACAYEKSLILIVAAPSLPERAPEATAMLRQWELALDDYKSMALWRMENDASYSETAIWWLNEKSDIWRQWVTEEAAAAIMDALEMGERAAGWPD